MDKIIQDIVEVDLACSQMVEDAKKKKLDIQSNMSVKKKEIYDSFVKEYQGKVDGHKKKLEEKIKENRAESEQQYQVSLEQLTKLYEDNKEEWISALVARCQDI